MNEMGLRRLSGVRTDQTTSAVVDRAEVLAGRDPDPSAVVEELIAVAEGRQFVLDAAYAVALRRHRGDTDPSLAVQLLEMANYTLQHRRRAGPRTGRILSYINLLIHGSAVLVFLGMTVWAAWLAVLERYSLLVVAVLFLAFGSARLAYSTWKLTLLLDSDRLGSKSRPQTTSDTGRPRTIPQLVADTMEAARRVAAQEAISTNPIEELAEPLEAVKAELSPSIGPRWSWKRLSAEHLSSLRCAVSIVASSSCSAKPGDRSTLDPGDKPSLEARGSARVPEQFSRYVSEGQRLKGEGTMEGYVARKGDRWYAVIYEGLDPITGRERRSWYPAGISREEAERLAAKLADELNGRDDDVRSLTFGAYLTERWLPAKRLALADSTWDGYRRKIDHHILPALGRIPIRRLRDHHLERLYGQKLHPTDGNRPLAPKTVLEIHLIIRAALNDVVRKGLVSRNVALVADAPKLRLIPKVEQKAWTASQLQAFLREAAAHRLFPAMWLVANTGLRRSELLGLKWDDVDFDTAALSVNRGLVAVGYKLHETRGKTSNSRRRVDVAPTTMRVLSAWRDWQQTKQAVTGVQSAGWVFTDDEGQPIHPHSFSQGFDRIVTRADVPRVRLHDVRHTHGTLLIKAGVPVKVVSERLGHANPAFTIDTYQHVLPGMQAEAARIFENLINPE